jgi:hypothetical protein
MGTGRPCATHASSTHSIRSTAIDLYRAMDMTFWLPQAEAALVQVSR